MRSRPSGNFRSFHLATKETGFGDQHLSEHSAGAFTRKFAQRIDNGLRLTECDDSGISRHGVSLLSGGSGRLKPASIRRLQSIVVTQFRLSSRQARWRAKRNALAHKAVLDEARKPWDLRKARRDDADGYIHEALNWWTAYASTGCAAR